jgi:hypothetical protein
MKYLTFAPKGKRELRTYSGTASLFQQISSNAYVILTSASNLVRYEWDEEQQKYVPDYP